MDLSTELTCRYLVRELDAIAIVGDGRLGRALAAALRAAGRRVDGPLPRGSAATGATLALLCVPDGEIAAAGRAVAPGPLVGHCSGATGLEALAPHEALSVHPLMTVPRDAPAGILRGAGCAVAGSTPAVAARRSAAPSSVTRKFEAIEAAAW